MLKKHRRIGVFCGRIAAEGNNKNKMQIEVQRGTTIKICDVSDQTSRALTQAEKFLDRQKLIYQLRSRNAEEFKAIEEFMELLTKNFSR